MDRGNYASRVYVLKQMIMRSDSTKNVYTDREKNSKLYIEDLYLRVLRAYHCHSVGWVGNGSVLKTSEAKNYFRKTMLAVEIRSDIDDVGIHNGEISYAGRCYKNTTSRSGH